MPRDLFGEVTRPSMSIGNRKWYTVPVSLLSHAVIVGAAVVIPLLATDVMPDPFETIGSVTLVEPVVPPPPPLPPKQREITPVEPPNAEAAPIEAPDGVTPEKPIEPRWEDGLVPTGVVVGVADANAIIAPPPPPPVRQEPVRVGGAIRQPQKVREVALKSALGWQ
jgi:hypothetical protein